ncbi:MAG: 50S ribosomal protein L13 [Candidatus Omnitrophota bacterium]|nr:50S ribosomal protein L13 [Candidatus Omnitrophota bacterium]
MVKHDDVPRSWHLVNAEGQVLGRLATKVAGLLRGKHKAVFTPHVDCGDGVIVINSEKIKVTGTKLDTKTYQSYSGYPDGQKREPLRRLLDRRPTEAVHRAVVGMLPKNPLGRRAAKRLRVYAGPSHPHDAQMPVEKSK